MVWVFVYIIGIVLGVAFFERVIQQRTNNLAEEDLPAYRLWIVIVALFWPITTPLILTMLMPDILEDFESWLRRRKWRKKAGKES